MRYLWPREQCVKFLSSKWSSSGKASLDCLLQWGRVFIGKRKGSTCAQCSSSVAVAVTNPPANRLRGRKAMDVCSRSQSSVLLRLTTTTPEQMPTPEWPAKREKHSVVRCVRRISPFLQRHLSITCTGSGKSVLGLPTLQELHELLRVSQRAVRSLQTAGSQTAEAAGKRRPTEGERWRNRTLPSPPESAVQACRGLEINVDKVGWAPLPSLH